MLQKRVVGVFGRAYRESLTHEQILASLKTEVWEHRDYPRISSYHRAMITGAHHACSDMLHATGALRWQLYLDGVRLASSDEVSLGATDDADRLARWARVTGRHEWAHTGRAFTEGGPVVEHKAA